MWFRYVDPLVPAYLTDLYEAEVIVLSVKPNISSEALESLSKHDLSNKLIVSVMAGIKIQTIKTNLRCENVDVVRVMPNAPIMVHKGLTAIYDPGNRHGVTLESLFGNSSKIYTCDDENDLHNFVAISGSGPAYFFMFMRCLTEAAKKIGLKNPASVAIQTALGAATLASSSNMTLEQLESMVASKGGTTERALQSFENDNLESVVQRAVEACLERSRELES